jgi:protein-disulfide isomerase
MSVLTLTALVMAAVLVHREFFANAPQKPMRAPPEYVESWRDVLGTAVVGDNRDAPVQIIEFMDLECPFCRHFNALTRALAREYGGRVSVGVVHYPLEGMHRFARPAAAAAECAAELGRFGQMVDAIYDKQDSLGLKSWGSYAWDAGVRDTVAFGKCLPKGHRSPRIDAGLSTARRLAITGTPTVMINGWLLRNPPNQNELEEAVAAILAGKSPF